VTCITDVHLQALCYLTNVVKLTILMLSTRLCVIVIKSSTYVQLWSDSARNGM